MHWSARREAFRARLQEPRCFHPASVHDPISARIAEDLGFELGMFAGSVASMTVLGAPDLIVLTLSEFAGQAYRINRAADLPLLVDADHGYGNALNVQRTVNELETAGVAALTIEDTELPRSYASGDVPSLLSIAEGAGKMRAALAARQDASLVIAGRTSAMDIAGVADTVARIRAYQKCGVDAIFLTGVRNLEQLNAVAEVARVPLFLGGAGAAINDRELLAEHGVSISLQGHQPFAAAVRAIETTLRALREGVAPKDLRGIASADTMARLTRDSTYRDAINRYLEP